MASDVAKRVATLRRLPLVADMLGQLTRELSPQLTYHSVEHTEDVLHEVVEFALGDGLSEREIELLAIAATYHDSGFLERREDNEPIGAQKARAAMKASATYSEEEIVLVEQCILDTKMQATPDGRKQVASSELSRYLLDADLSNFGRSDFFEKFELSRQEFGWDDDDEFIRSVIRCLENHDWLTTPAHQMRHAQEQKNLQQLRAMLKE